MQAEGFIIESPQFYEMHKIQGDYETRGPTEILEVEKLRVGFKQLEMGVTLYDRPTAKMTTFSDNLKLKPGQAITTIKFLYRFDPVKDIKEPSPIFFFAYRNYQSRVSKYRDDLRDFCLKTEDHGDLFKVSSILQVPIGGVYAVAVPTEALPDKFVRVRVTKINLCNQKITYWAIDEAFFGVCQPSHLIRLNDTCVRWEILAVPGVFETDPRPELLDKFTSENTIGFCLAKVIQPKYMFDYIPRKVELKE